MASARKLPSGNYRVNLFVGEDENGKRKFKSFTAPTKKEAEFMAAQYNLTRKEKPKIEMTVGEAIDRYLNDRSNILSPSTMRSEKSRRKNNYSKIESVKIADLNVVKIQRWINDFAKDHSPKTVRNVYYLFTSAVHALEKDADLAADLPEKIKYIPYFPEEDQIFQLLDYYIGKPEIQAALMVASILGLRRAEICALEYGDISPNGKIVVRRSLALGPDRVWHVKSPKSEEGTRELSLPDYLKEKLLSIKNENCQDDRIFHFNPNNLTDYFTAARKKIGFKFRLHDLRHYYASVMLYLNVPNRYAMKRMGHSTDTMLKRVYQHLMEDKEKSVDQETTEYMSRFSSVKTIQHEIQHETEKST